MKRILTILAVLVSFAAAAQIPGSTTVNSRYDWLGGHFKQLKLPAYADTTDVPDWAPWLSGDAMLDTSGGNAGTIYVRYGSPRAWHALSGSGSSSGGISEWIAGFGLTQVNDSTGAVDSLTIASRDRLYQQRDSLLALINLRMKYTDTANQTLGYVRVNRFLDSLSAVRARAVRSLTGDITGTENGSGVIPTTLATVNSNVGSFTNANVTVNAKGQVTAASNGSSGSSTSLTGIRDSLLNPQDWKARITYRLDASYIDTMRSFGTSIENHYLVTRGYNDQLASLMGMTSVVLASNGTGTHYTVGAINNNTQVWTKAVVVIGTPAFNTIRADSSAIAFAKVGQAYRSMLLSSWIGTFYAASAMTQSGTWTGFNGSSTLAGKAGGAAGGSSAFNNVSGSYVQQTFTGTGVGVAYYHSIVGGFSGGEIDIAIDGVTVHHEVLNKTNSADPQTPGAWFITGLENVSHTIRITNTTNNYVYLDYVGVLKAPGDANPVLAMGIPKMNTTGYATAPSQANDRNFNRADDTIRAVLHEAAGYPARFVPTNWTLNTSTDIQSDSIHMNEIGHYHMLQVAAENISRRDAPLAASGITKGILSNAYQLIYGSKGLANGGLMVFGDNATRPSGGHVDLAWVAGTGYMRFLNATTPAPGLIGGSTLTFQISNLTYFDINSSGVGTFGRGLLINQGGASTPTIIGTNGNANSVYVRANDGNFGLNTNNPISKFHVNGSARVGDSLIIARSAVVGTSADSLLGRNATTGQAYTIAPASSFGAANINFAVTGYPLVIQATQALKRIAPGTSMLIDSSTTGLYTLNADTTTSATNLATQGDITRALVNITAAEYTPTVTGTSNIASITLFSARYMRIGNIVDVTGSVTIAATATSTNTSFTITLPFASNFTDGSGKDASGNITENSGTTGTATANPTNDNIDATYISGSTAGRLVTFHFKYTIL